MASEALAGSLVVDPAGGVLRRGASGGLVLEDRLAEARKGEPFYDNGKVACYQVSETEDFCEPSRLGAALP